MRLGNFALTAKIVPSGLLTRNTTEEAPAAKIIPLQSIFLALAHVRILKRHMVHHAFPELLHTWSRMQSLKVMLQVK